MNSPSFSTTNQRKKMKITITRPKPLRMTYGTVDDGHELFSVPGVAAIMYTYMGLTIDATLEAIRELRKVPAFQRHEGKRTLNRLHRLSLECDDRMCRLVGNKDLAWLENAKEIFAEEIAPDIMKFRISVANVIGRTEYPYTEAYAYAIVAHNIARVTSFQEEGCIFQHFGSQFTGGWQVPSAMKATYRMYGTLQFDNALKEVGAVFDKDPRLANNLKCAPDLRNISNGSRILVDRLAHTERIEQIANEQQALALARNE